MAKIPVVLCIDSRIILGTAVTIKSMLETAKPETTYDIRIFHSGLSASDEKNIQELVAGTRHELKLHYIDPARFDGAPRNKGSWTEIVYYRLLTPEILTEYDKAIYSDVDVLIKEDLSEAYNTDLEGYEIAAVPTTLNEVLKTLQPARYFEENKNKYIYASGFIIFNNKLMREEKTVDKFFDTIKTFNSRLVFFDMDTLNITCNKVKNLPLKYCVFETLYEYTDVTTIPEYKNLKTVYSDTELYEAKNHPIVIHYAGKLGKPWQRKRVPQYYQEYIDKLGQKYQRYTFRDLRKKFLSKPKYPEQHFDVGLVNFYHSQNYGACLTAYALQEAIKSLGATYTLINHSERTTKMHENLEISKQKLEQAFSNDLIPIICIGDTLEEHEKGTYVEKIKKDMDYLLSDIDKSKDFIIAYEPVFAIGTGIVPTNLDIEKVTTMLKDEYHKKVLYGGSANENNIDELKQVKDIDGFLLGGISLKLPSLQEFLDKL